jgi:tripartite-type tricarboxylate transporter receptor subunit TctC
MQEFRAWAMAHPQGVTFSSSVVGTTPHLSGELFGQRTGIKVVHVPFRGSVTTEVIAGTIDFAIDNIASCTPFLKAGKARALAVTSPERCPVFPDVPTMVEAGVRDFVVTSWGALVMPAATPAAVTQKLSQAMQEIAADPATRERIKWKEFVRLSGAKLE